MKYRPIDRVECKDGDVIVRKNGRMTLMRGDREVCVSWVNDDNYFEIREPEPEPEPEPMFYVESENYCSGGWFADRTGPMPKTKAEYLALTRKSHTNKRNVRITPITPRVWWRHSECSNASYFYDGERFACQQYGPFIRPARPDEVPIVGYVLATDPYSVREA
jgi:hypothetical protein